MEGEMAMVEAEMVGDIHRDVKYVVNSDTEHNSAVKGSIEASTDGKIPRKIHNLIHNTIHMHIICLFHQR